MPLEEGREFKKGSGTVVRSTLRAVPATVPDPFLNHAGDWGEIVRCVCVWVYVMVVQIPGSTAFGVSVECVKPKLDWEPNNNE